MYGCHWLCVPGCKNAAHSDRRCAIDLNDVDGDEADDDEDNRTA